MHSQIDNRVKERVGRCLPKRLKSFERAGDRWQEAILCLFGVCALSRELLPRFVQIERLRADGCSQ